MTVFPITVETLTTTLVAKFRTMCAQLEFEYTHHGAEEQKRRESVICLAIT